MGIWHTGVQASLPCPSSLSSMSTISPVGITVCRSSSRPCTELPMGCYLCHTQIHTRSGSVSVQCPVSRAISTLSTVAKARQPNPSHRFVLHFTLSSFSHAPPPRRSTVLYCIVLYSLGDTQLKPQKKTFSNNKRLQDYTNHAASTTGWWKKARQHLVQAHLRSRKLDIRVNQFLDACMDIRTSFPISVRRSDRSTLPVRRSRRLDPGLGS
ncbi:hypothetical protein BKA65DRAFT_275586 [Rhexocercosporidium sp. MPI-PUGE-AT-0058]|nr:hypothetical protein BKA65DRAFT_275586 [Rhexocercosporidium sp. MPI-PUGE-AT-0058]